MGEKFERQLKEMDIKMQAAFILFPQICKGIKLDTIYLLTDAEHLANELLKVYSITNETKIKYN